MLNWNKNIKMVLSDVDETIADLYLPAEKEMISELNRLLDSGIVLFFITGQGVKNVHERIVCHLNPTSWPRILIGHCSGAEVWGYRSDSTLETHPYYSLYEETTTPSQRLEWRELVGQIISEFRLRVYPVMPVESFLQETRGDPLAVMLDDRGPQITIEVVNGYNLTEAQVYSLPFSIPVTRGVKDLRAPICARADELYKCAELPFTSRLGGVFAIDFAINGASKKTAVTYILKNHNILSRFGLIISDLQDPYSIEIWGDKFSILNGGTDRHMSEAVHKNVRSINFREEDPSEFPSGFNIQIWNGQHHLHRGLLEYLQSKA